MARKGRIDCHAPHRTGLVRRSLHGRSLCRNPRAPTLDIVQAPRSISDNTRHASKRRRAQGIEARRYVMARRGRQGRQRRH